MQPMQKITLKKIPLSTQNKEELGSKKRKKKEKKKKKKLGGREKRSYLNESKKCPILKIEQSTENLYG